MRIVAGRWRGRRIESPSGTLVRPTGDRVRESWMSIVHPILPDARVVDLCAGTGALGLEALSRGAAHCAFIEKSGTVLRTLQANIALLGAEGMSEIHRDDAMRFATALAAGAYDVAFADPPYDTDIAVRLAEQWLAVPFAHLLGIEHSAAVVLPGSGDTRRYGTSAITIYR